MTVDGTNQHSYAYDDTYQVVDVDYPDSSSTEYDYDKVGNRETVDDGSQTSYSANNLNQYTSVGGTNYSYDGNGNLTNDGAYKYYYGCENHLTDVNDINDQKVASYVYDFNGRRIAKTTYGETSITTKYCYDGDQVIAEYDGDGTLLRRFVYGHCTIWEDSTFTTERTEPADTTAYPNPYLFTGRRIDYLDDDVSGDPQLELMYYRNRSYDTYTGRFLQHDPLGYVDGMNLYEYVRNNPIIFFDPYGLALVVLPTPTTKYPWGNEFSLGNCSLYCNAKYYLGKLTPGWEGIIEEILSKWWKKLFKWLCSAQSLGDLNSCLQTCIRWKDQIVDTFDDPVLEPGGDPWPK